MNKTIKILLLLIIYVTIACDNSKKKPKIAIAGLAIESSTFSNAKR